MAVMSSIYKASIYKHDESGQNVSICPVDLSRLDFEFDRIVIQDDVALGNGKSNLLPDFSKIEIKGEFDCSTYTLTSSSVLPKGIIALKCLHSISTLDVLFGIKLPESIERIYIRNSLINGIKSDEEVLKKAKAFLKKHPTIKVYGKSENLCLNNVIEALEKKKEVAPVKRSGPVRPSPVASVVKSKVPEGYVDIAMAVKELRELDEYKHISVRDLRGMVKKFLYLNNQDGQWGKIQGYVFADKLSDLAVQLLIDGVLEVVEKQAEKQPVIETKKPVAALEKKVPVAEELKPVKIKKYFDKSVWSDVVKVCKGDARAIKKFLEDIDSVNMPFNMNRSGTGKVAGIKNGEIKNIPNLEHKKGSFIAQGFGRANNRPRVLWAILGSDTLVAFEFFSNHGDGKDKINYHSAIYNSSKEKIKSSFTENFDNYLDLDDLMTQVLEELAGKEKPVEVSKPEVATVAKEEPVVPAADKKEVSEIKAEKVQAPVELVPLERSLAELKRFESLEKISQIATLPVKKKRGRPAKNAKQSEDAVKASQDFEIADDGTIIRKNIPSIKENNVVEKPEVKVEKSEPAKQAPAWKDVASIDYSLTDVYDIMNKDIYDIKQELLKEQDTEKSLALTERLTKALKQKKKMEENEDIVKKTLEIFARISSERGNKSR